MTPDERALLIAIGREVSEAWGLRATIDPLIEAVVAGPPRLTPRTKYVSIEHAPDPAGVAGRWKYARERGGKWQDPKRDEAKYVELQALGENPKHADVAAVVGDSWAYLSCDGCGETKLVRAVRIDGPYGDGNRYCPTCIREAAALLETIE